MDPPLVPRPQALSTDWACPLTTLWPVATFPTKFVFGSDLLLVGALGGVIGDNEGAPPPAGGTRGVPAGLPRGRPHFFLPVHHRFIVPAF
jgi:hypothetical protein